MRPGGVSVSVMYVSSSPSSISHLIIILASSSYTTTYYIIFPFHSRNSNNPFSALTHFEGPQHFSTPFVRDSRFILNLSASSTPNSISSMDEIKRAAAEATSSLMYHAPIAGRDGGKVPAVGTTAMVQPSMTAHSAQTLHPPTIDSHGNSGGGSNGDGADDRVQHLVADTSKGAAMTPPASTVNAVATTVPSWEGPIKATSSSNVAPIQVAPHPRTVKALQQLKPTDAIHGAEASLPSERAEGEINQDVAYPSTPCSPALDHLARTVHDGAKQVWCM